MHCMHAVHATLRSRTPYAMCTKSFPLLRASEFTCTCKIVRMWNRSTQGIDVALPFSPCTDGRETLSHCSCRNGIKPQHPISALLFETALHCDDRNRQESDMTEPINDLRTVADPMRTRRPRQQRIASPGVV